MLRKIVISAMFAITFPGLASAEELLESYVALLSSQDHFNSGGTRLTLPWQIIRQDRANFHKFGKRDDLDEWDSFFGSIENRAAAERMLARGSISPGLSAKIVNGEVVIRVEIFGNGTKGTSLRVIVY